MWCEEYAIAFMPHGSDVAGLSATARREMSDTEITEADARALYLDLLKKALMDVLHSERDLYVPVRTMRNGSLKVRGLKVFDRLIASKGYAVTRQVPPDFEQRLQGKGVWPMYAQTMIGAERLNNIQFCIEEVIRNGTDGDLIETGVWRGGSTIFMRAVLRAYGVKDKIVWVADSFEGLPGPDEAKYPGDKGLKYHTFEELKVSLDEVKRNFAAYAMLDEQVRFLKGWFKDTLPVAPIRKLSVLRLDGDMYESTIDALTHLYPKLSVGGYVIIDDYHWIEACRQAVTDYRSKHRIDEVIRDVDWTAVYWQKTK